MGVELRVHTFFLLLAVVCLGLGASDGIRRGLGLFMTLVLAILVRETVRLVAAAWLGLRLRAILVLPIGGMFAYANPESQEMANQGAGQFVLAFAGPVANGAAALVLAATFLGSAGNVNLVSQPWISSAHLLRSLVWMQAGLGFLHLLPAYPLDCGRLMRGSFARKHGIAPAGRAATGVGQLLALAAMIGGMLLHSPWLIIAGFFIMIGAQIEDQGVFFQSVVDTVRMREVMLTDFATLSPSDTLADALSRCVHSLQEDFPVVRGPAAGGHRFAAADRRCPAQRGQRLRAVGNVARIPGGPARGHPGHHHPAPHRRPRAVADPGYGERSRGGHRERAEPDEFHDPARRAAPPGTGRSGRKLEVQLLAL